jgi:hypothetical protein
VVILIVLGLLCAAGAWTVVAAGSSDDRAIRVPLASGITRATRFYRVGPSADYSYDYGNIGGVHPLVVSLPEGATYDVVVSVTLGYRTSPDDRFVVALWVRRDAEFGDIQRVVPHERPLWPSPVRTTTSASFRLSDLRGGHEYWVSPTVNVSHREGNRASISTDAVLVVVDAVPST